MHRLLVIVDYQYDFVADDGKLTAGSVAQKIEPVIKQKIEDYLTKKDKVIFTLDHHTDEDFENNEHPESKVFPKHCIKGTDGFELFGRVKEYSNSCYFVEKRAYCPDVSDSFFASSIFSSDEIEICGVVTDICVLQTAIGIYTALINNKKSAKLIIDAAACASFNHERELFALDYMRDILGANIINY